MKNNYKRFMKKISFALVALSMIISMVSLTAFAEEDVDWNGDNTLLVTVTTAEDGVFYAADFPQVDCTEVIVASKKTAENGYTYDLILKLAPSSCGDLDKAIDAVSKNDNVSNARRNEYAYINSEIQLNCTELSLQVGEKADISAEKLSFYNNNFSYLGIIFTVDPEVFDISTANKDTFGVNFYPITKEGDYGELDWFESNNQSERFTVSPINKYYAVKRCSRTYAYEIVKIVNAMLAAKGVLTAEPYCEAVPAGALPSEQWTLDNEDVADISLSGGEETGVTGNLVGQTATVTAVYAGTTTLTLNRNDTDSSASATCTITVYMKGDANSDGAYDNLDAALILKYDAGLIDMSEELTEECDINGDGVADNLDAALMLKYDAGVRFEL